VLYCDISFVSLQMNTSTDFIVTDDDDDKFVVLYADYDNFISHL
jgi:hypothetical protein